MQTVQTTAQAHDGGEPAAFKTGWLRLTLRLGLTIGMLAQLIVLSDLKSVVLGGQRSPWFTGPAALPTIFAILAGTAWGAAFWWGRSQTATASAAIASIFSWAYYRFFPPTGEWFFFASSQHFVLFLLPFFPFLWLATGTVLRDAVVHVRQPAGPRTSRTGSEAASVSGFTIKLGRAMHGLLKRVEDTALFVPCLYGFTALIFLLHPDLFRWNQDINSALRQSWNLTWPYNFAWLPHIAALALTGAAALRKPAARTSKKLALFGGVLGSAYSVGALAAMNQHLVDAKRYPSLRATPLAADSDYFNWLALSLAPSLLAAFFAVRDAGKIESTPNVLLRAISTVCFSVFVLSARFEEYRTANGLQWIVLLFGMAYLVIAFHPSSWHDYVLGAGVGLAIAVFRVFGLFHAHVPHSLTFMNTMPVPYRWRNATLLLALTSSNILLVLAVAGNILANGERVRVWRAMAGFGLALLFGALLFAALLIVG